MQTVTSIGDYNVYCYGYYYGKGDGGGDMKCEKKHEKYRILQERNIKGRPN
jgi:hypothetical protein